MVTQNIGVRMSSFEETVFTLLHWRFFQVLGAVFESRELPQEQQRHGSDGAVPLLGDD
jgi:hypothetical protein